MVDSNKRKWHLVEGLFVRLISVWSSEIIIVQIKKKAERWMYRTDWKRKELMDRCIPIKWSYIEDLDSRENISILFKLIDKYAEHAVNKSFFEEG
jgi:hypothetical protein